MVKQYLLFEIGGRPYCACLDTVREVRRLGAVTEVPQSAEHILGVVNLRGDILPVIDLKNLLTIQSRQSTAHLVGAGKNLSVQTSVEQKTADQQVVDQKAHDPKAHDPKAHDQKVADQKVADQATCLIAQVGERMAAFCVDSVSDVIEVNISSILPLPAAVKSAKSDLFLGLLLVNEIHYTELNLRQLIHAIEQPEEVV